ncbi:MAG: hypothetical protein J6V21_05490 [Alistipes sp.]|nr:hypothetical protein [Alistipes sp.]
MKFSKEEQEIIKILVKYSNKGGNIAAVFNFTQLLGKRGLGIVRAGSKELLFFRKDLHPNFFPGNGSPYISMLLNLLEQLIDKRLLILGNSITSAPLVIGALASRWERPNVLVVNESEVIVLEGFNKGWYDANGRVIYNWDDDRSGRLAKLSHYLYHSYSVSEELKDLVKHNFKTEEQIRFAKQQRLNWIGIGVAILVGILGIIF